MTVQRTGGDSIYGSGSDGTVIITSNISLSRDVYYDNLTVSSGGNLNTNGFKIFVKNTLTLNGNITTGFNYTSGTLSLPANIGSGNVSFSIGSNSFGNTFTASSITDGQKKDIESLISGTLVLSNGTIVGITGGAPGQNGANGIVTANTAGGVGQLDRNPLVAGGPGTPGSAVTASLGGQGGAGGPVTLIVAKNIVGSGSISHRGGTASGGAASQTGANGVAANNATLTHNVDGTAHYITGNGSTGPHATTSVPNLPHGGHLPHRTNDRHGHTFHHMHRGNVHHSACSGDCFDICGGAGGRGHYNHGHNHFTGQAGVPNHAGDYAHHSGDFNNSHHIDAQLTDQYFAINGINHTPGHRNNIGEARIGHSTHTSGFFHVGHDAPHHSTHSPGHGGKFSCSAYHIVYAAPRHHWQQNHAHFIFRNAGSVSSVGSNTKLGGTAGIGGSSTAGQPGIPGGAGGIIVISDAISQSITMSALGGQNLTSNVTSPSGQVITIINT